MRMSFEFLLAVNPVEDAVVAPAQFAKSHEVVRHSDQSPMHEAGGVFRKPKNFSFGAGPDGGIQFSKLRVRLLPASPW